MNIYQDPTWQALKERFDQTEQFIKETSQQMRETEQFIKETGQQMRENDLRLTKMSEETDRRMQETDRLIKENDLRLTKMREETDRQMKENARQMKETDRQMKENDARLTKMRKESDLRLAKMRKETDRMMKENSREIKENNREIKENSREIKELNRSLGGISNSNGDMAEEFFFNIFKKSKTFVDEHYDSIQKNYFYSNGEVGTESDIILFNGTSVAIIEVKYKANQNNIRIEKLISNVALFKKCSPIYRYHKVYLGVAAMSFGKGLEKELHNAGIATIHPLGKKIVIYDRDVKGF
jgi:Holliday junction resolvase-like predicted endonuclease